MSEANESFAKDGMPNLPVAAPSGDTIRPEASAALDRIMAEFVRQNRKPERLVHGIRLPFDGRRVLRARHTMAQPTAQPMSWAATGHFTLSRKNTLSPASFSVS